MSRVSDIVFGGFNVESKSSYEEFASHFQNSPSKDSYPAVNQHYKKTDLFGGEVAPARHSPIKRNDYNKSNVFDNQPLPCVKITKKNHLASNIFFDEAPRQVRPAAIAAEPEYVPSGGDPVRQYEETRLQGSRYSLSNQTSSVFEDSPQAPARTRRHFNYQNSDIFNQTDEIAAPIKREEPVWMPKAEQHKSASFSNLFGQEPVDSNESAPRTEMDRPGGLSRNELNRQRGGRARPSLPRSQIWF